MRFSTQFSAVAGHNQGRFFGGLILADKDQVLKVLRQRFLRRINFSFAGGAGDVSITSKSFEKIIALIEADNMGVQVVKEMDFAGEWHPDDNTLVILPIMGRMAEATVLHESLHGWFDMEQIPIMAVQEEAACYVVDVLYFRMTGLADARFVDPIYDAAKPIARAILAASVSGKTPTVAVDTAQWKKLLGAVRADPAYEKIKDETVSYTHDG